MTSSSSERRISPYYRRRRKNRTRLLLGNGELESIERLVGIRERAVAQRGQKQFHHGVLLFQDGHAMVTRLGGERGKEIPLPYAVGFDDMDSVRFERVVGGVGAGENDGRR